MDVVTLILEMKILQENIDILDDRMKVLRGKYDQLRLFDIPNTMAETNDMRSINGDWGRCTLTSDMHVKVEDKQGLHRWLEESGNGSLIVPTVNAQTLKAFVKEQIVNGNELPSILTVSPFTRAVLYKK